MFEYICIYFSFLSLNSHPMSSFKTNPNAIIKIYFISYYRFCLILSNSDTSKGIKSRSLMQKRILLSKIKGQNLVKLLVFAFWLLVNISTITSSIKKVSCLYFWRRSKNAISIIFNYEKSISQRVKFNFWVFQDSSHFLNFYSYLPYWQNKDRKENWIKK